MDLESVLTGNAWESDNGHIMLFTRERYFVFEENGDVFDIGRIEYNILDKNILLENNMARGYLSVEQRKNGLYLDGRLNSAMAGNIIIQNSLKKIKEGPGIPLSKSMQEAAYYADLESVKGFLDKGGEVDSQDEKGETALMQACTLVSFELCKFLLKQGANVNIVDNDGESALHKSISSKNIKLFKSLLKEGAKYETFSGDKNIINYALSKGVEAEFIKYILSLFKNKKSLMDALNADSISVLNSAMYDYSQGFFSAIENEGVFKLILKTGIDLEQKNKNNGNTIFLDAVSNGALKIAKLLVKHGVNLNATNNQHETAIDLLGSVSEDENSAVKNEFYELFKQHGLTLTKKDIIKEKIDNIKKTSKKEGVSRAIDNLKEFERDLSRVDYCEISIDILLSEKNPEFENLKEAYNLKNKLYNAGDITIKDFIVFGKKTLIDIMQNYSEEDNSSKTKVSWAEFEILDKVGLYIDRGDNDEYLLNELLEIVIKEGRGIALDQFEPEDHRTPYTNLANERALSIYDKLIEIDEIKYLNEKVRFLIKIKQRWMEEHFDCHNKMLSLDLDNELTLKLGDALREEFDRRHPKESSMSTYPVCPVPMENAFDKSVALYKETEYAAINEWYFRYIVKASIGDKSAWHGWISLKERLSGRFPYEVLQKAIEKGAPSHHGYWSQLYAEKACEYGDQDDALQYIINAAAEIEPYRSALMPLIRCGAHMNRCNDSGASYFLKVIQNLSDQSYNENFEYIIDHCDLDLDYVEPQYELPLFFLFANSLSQNDNMIAPLEKMYKAGVNVDYRHKPSGETCLYNQAQKGHLHQLKILIEQFKCDPDITAKNGFTPLDIAQKNGFNDVVKYLSSISKSDFEMDEKKAAEKSLQELYESLSYSEVDDAFLEKFNKNLDKFDSDKARDLYYKLVDKYKEDRNELVLDAISCFFKSQDPSLEISYEIRSFFRHLEYLKVADSDIRLFFSGISDTMIKSFGLEDNNTVMHDSYKLLYQYTIVAEYLPDLHTCVEKIFDEDESEQSKYASYLLCMGENINNDKFSQNKKIDKKEIEYKIMERLVCAYGEKINQWMSLFDLPIDKMDKKSTSVNLQGMLLEVLGNMQAKEKASQFLLLFALSSFEHKVKDHAVSALKKAGCSCLESISVCFNKLQEDFARTALIEVLESYESCRGEVIEFLNSIETSDSYLQGQVDELKDGLQHMS